MPNIKPISDLRNYTAAIYLIYFLKNFQIYLYSY